jgi:G3E family GTPase
MPDEKRLKINLLTGFLGSGKTTILNALLRDPHMPRSAVIVNEFGEIGIDHLLVAKSSDNIIELSNGCLCCTIQSDLVTTLFGLYAARVDGTIPLFERVIIETTGLAEPAPILLTLFRDQVVAPRYVLDSVVTVVDAVNGFRTLALQRESVKQVAAADLLLLTKTDLSTEGVTAALRAQLAAINPGCPIIDVVGGAVDPSVLQPPKIHQQPDPSVAARQWISVDESHPHYSGSGIGCRAVAIDDPIAWPNFLAWVSSAREMLGPNLLRIKGLITIADRPDGPLVVHAVQDVFHPPAFLPAWPSADRRSRLVFITRDIDPALIEHTLTLLQRDERS